MRIIISDSSCLIDLHKVDLLEALMELPFSIGIPQPLFETELLSISDDEKQRLLDLGLEVIVQPAEQVISAQQYYNNDRKLSLNDCFALVAAEYTDEAILFTGDSRLKSLADSKDIETHGVLWAIDMLDEHTNIDTSDLIACLEQFDADPRVWYPSEEIRARIRRLRRKLAN